MNSNQKRADVATLLSDKMTLNQKLLQELKKELYNDKRVNSPRKYSNY